MSGSMSSARSIGRFDANLKGELETLFLKAATTSGMVGAQVSVILGDGRVDFVYGSANVELNIPMTEDTVMQVGSVCKVFNAAMIMTLVEEGKLALDTPIIRYIPEFKLSDKVAQDCITLRHLLSMNSGLDQGPYDQFGGGDEVLAKFVAAMDNIPQLYPPGQGFGYSNAGTNVAGYVAQRVTGIAWDTLIQQRIFEPAGLKHALTVFEDLPFHRVSAGHGLAEGGQPPKVLRPWYITRAQGPSGSTLTMSAQDLATFGQIFVNGGKAANGNRVLSEESVKTMMTPITDVPISASYAGVGQKWGVGPSMDRWGETTVWGHAGGNRSGSSRVFWFPERRGVLAAVKNTVDADDVFTRVILGDFSSLAFGGAAPLPAAPKVPVPLENPERFIGHYQRHGTRYEVSADAGHLRFKEIAFGSGKNVEQLGVIRDSKLIPVRRDCFLIESTLAGRDPVPPTQSPIGFFGSDEQGRAMNVATPIVTARRI